MSEFELDGVELTAKINLTPGYYRRDADGDEAGPATLLDALLVEAASQLLRGATREELSGYRASVGQRVSAIRDEEIRARIVPLVDAAFDRGNIPLTNNYGEPTGKTVSMTDLILEHVQREVKIGPLNRNGYRESENVMTKLVKDEIDRSLKGELKAVIDAAKTELRRTIEAEGAKVLAETISRMAGVA